MKTLLVASFVFLLVLNSLAQAPQGINYQAVALKAGGTPLANQAIGLQLSILDSAANGKVVYAETQNPTTDNAGLFSVVIGNGTSVTGNFASINWGKNYKWLKVEIDTTGGSNYVLMGITQLMSVPYALYANKTKSSYSSFDYPDDLNDISPVTITPIPFNIPAGKNLYIYPYNTGYGYFIVTGNDTLVSWFSTKGFGFSENQSVSVINDTIQGMLVNKSVDWKTVDIVANPISVPVDKIFIVKGSGLSPYGDKSSSVPKIFINGVQMGSVSWLITDYIVGSGQTLSATLSSAGQYMVNGYFRDK